jgi:hypothetical protein
MLCRKEYWTKKFRSKLLESVASTIKNMMIVNDGCHESLGV